MDIDFGCTFEGKVNTCLLNSLCGAIQHASSIVPETRDVLAVIKALRPIDDSTAFMSPLQMDDVEFGANLQEHVRMFLTRYDIKKLNLFVDGRFYVTIDVFSGGDHTIGINLVNYAHWVERRIAVQPPPPRCDMTALDHVCAMILDAQFRKEDAQIALDSMLARQLAIVA